MDILIVLLTIVGGFGLFLGIGFLILVSMPRIKENVNTLYSKVRKRTRLPANPRNPYGYADHSK